MSHTRHDSEWANQATLLIEARRHTEVQALVETHAKRMKNEQNGDAFTRALHWVKAWGYRLDPDHLADCLADRRRLTPSQRKVLTMLAKAIARLDGIAL